MRLPEVTGGPDAARYLHLARGGSVPRPFHLRWLLPAVCGTGGRWWVAWFVSWPLMVAGFVGWRMSAGDSWQTAAIGAVLLAGLPGILGPNAVIPVGVDLPATAVALCGCWVATSAGVGWAVPLFLLAGACKETAPVFAACWLWSPWPLIGLVAVAARALIVHPGPDPLGPKFQRIADFPISTAIEARLGRWRDGWLLLAPWGVCLLGLHSPPLSVVVVLVVAYGQLLVATDTVRLVQHAAGPALAAAAAPLVPPAWAPLILAAHCVWWGKPERI